MALSEDQGQRFNERLRQLGMNPGQVVDVLRTGDREGPTVLSHRAEESAVPPVWLQVDNVDTLKQLAGIPDEDYENERIPHHHEDLPPWPQEKNEHRPEDLSAQENEQVRKALIVHVYGHSPRVESYRTVVNNHYLPLNAAVFAAEDVVVDPDHPLVLKANNGGYNFGTVTIKPGGQIICEGDTRMTCQLMVCEGSGA